MNIPGVSGFGSGTLTVTAYPDADLIVSFHDSGGMLLGAETVPAGEVREIPERGAYASVSAALPIRRRDPTEAAERIRAGYRDLGIPGDIAEAMIEETLRGE